MLGEDTCFLFLFLLLFLVSHVLHWQLINLFYEVIHDICLLFSVL